MKPYGYTRTGKTRQWNLTWEDVSDIQIGARKSSIGKFPEKCGKYKSYTRSTKNRKRMRRYWNRRHRQIAKKEIQKTLKQ